MKGEKINMAGKRGDMEREKINMAGKGGIWKGKEYRKMGG